MNKNFFKKIDYIEFYVEDSYRTSKFYEDCLGFQIVAHGSPGTGLQNKISYILSQGNIRFIFSSPLKNKGPIAKHIYLHGDGIKDIAFLSENVESDFYEATQGGAIALSKPITIIEGSSEITQSSIAAFGDTTHTFIQRKGSEGWRLPFYKQLKQEKPTTSPALIDIDHMAVAIEKGTLNQWKTFYEKVLGLHETHCENISTHYSGMNSIVMGNEKGTIKIPLVEPVDGLNKSQISVFLESYNGPGVQHVAFLTNNIIKSINDFRNKGLQFLAVPESYYKNLENCVSSFDQKDFCLIKDLGILIELGEKGGALMQTFSKPLHSRPTFFIEIIQRNNMEGFGSNNIKALFESIEQNQMDISKIIAA